MLLWYNLYRKFERERKVLKMEKRILTNTVTNTSYNNGQRLEQIYRFTRCGKILKADNQKNAPDFENVQIKSARATICKGTDFENYIKENLAEIFAYVTKDLIAYEMNKTEFINFVKEFGTVTKESQKNGGDEKIRLGHESKKMREWLERA